VDGELAVRRTQMSREREGPIASRLMALFASLLRSAPTAVFIWLGVN